MLLLLASSRDPADGVEFNLKAEAAARGVHPDRIILDKVLPRAEHVWVSLVYLLVFAHFLRVDMAHGCTKLQQQHDSSL